MRALPRSAPLLLTLGLALAGCQAGDQGSADDLATRPQASGEYVLTVDGMV
jgi:hypothetical protein